MFYFLNTISKYNSNILYLFIETVLLSLNLFPEPTISE